ncbi:hypothetical protein [Marinobacter caseinilyticus]|uniref:hypothetical protein n=1 Tax=Marinobacter caseinilyticus TaxID=2692195 RepID=UPI00140CA8E1|nr:hypothetical protein [Marinobacter caseinilyticus]
MRLPPNCATAFIFLAFLLTGCGGSDAIDSIRNQPNSFPLAKNALDDFSDNTTPDSSNASRLAPDEVLITVEVPANLAPGGEETRRNLRIVKPDRVRAYRTNSNLQELSSVSTRQRIEDEGRVVIEFIDGLPIGPDIIIEASVGGDNLRALASDSDRDIKVNPFSEYLVRETLGNYTAGEFTQVMDCVNSTEEDLCLNKYVWSSLADQVQDFEIDIPSNVGVSGAVDFLGQQADFTHYVESMATYALVDNQSSGKITAQSVDYNSIFLGMELGQSYLVSDTRTPGQWGVRIATEKLLVDSNGTAYIYPGLTLTSFDVFNINVTSLASDVPYERTTVAQTSTNDFYERTSGYWDLNTQSTSPGAATLKDGLRLLAGRSLYQSITGQDSALTIGWARNPYYLDAYVGLNPESPDRVLGGYFSAGKAIELLRQNGQLKRNGILENHYVAALELNLARSDGFDLGQLDGGDYNVVSFSALLGTNGVPIRFEAGIGDWSVNGPTSEGRTVTQALADILVVRRNEDGTVLNGVIDRSGLRNLSHRTAQLNSGDKNIGRLNLDLVSPPATGGMPDLGVGASTPDGSLLAFNLDNGTTGDGVLIAARQTATTPDSGTYRVQGVTTAMAFDSNRLSHYQDATLTITSTSSADLILSGLSVLHDVPNENVQAPVALSGNSLSMAYTATGQGQVAFVSGDLRFEGFVTDDLDQMFLRVSNVAAAEKTLGLVMATRLP